MALSPEHQQQVEEIFSLTREMGEQASQKEWEQVAELERQRRDRLESLLKVVAPEESDEIAEAIRRVLEADRLIMEVGAEEKLHLMEEILQIGKGRKASKAYTETP